MKKIGIKGYGNVERVKRFLVEKGATDVDTCGFDFSDGDRIYYVNGDGRCDFVRTAQSELMDDIAPLKAFGDLKVGDKVVHNIFGFCQQNDNFLYTVTKIERVDDDNIKLWYGNNNWWVVNKWLSRIDDGDSYDSDTLTIFDNYAGGDIYNLREMP